MSLLRPRSVRVNVALGALLLGLVTALTACEEEGKTAPERCLDKPLPIYDIQAGGARDDTYPCSTPVGHAISSNGSISTAGTTASGGKAGSGGTGTAAGAGGAGGAP